MRVQRARQLHRQCRRTRDDVGVTERACGGAHDGDRIDAGMSVESAIFCRQNGLRGDRPELTETDEASACAVTRAHFAQQPVAFIDDPERSFSVWASELRGQRRRRHRQRDAAPATRRRV